MKEAAKNGVQMWLRFIFDKMKKDNITPYKLSKMSGVGQDTISNLLSGKNKNPTLQTIFQLLGALEIYPFLTTDKEAIKGFTYINFN